MENITELKSILARPRDILITSHRNPDGDAIGSSLGLKLFLEQEGHTVKVVVPSDFPHFLNWMPGASEVLIYDNDPEEIGKLMERMGMVFLLSLSRMR